MSRRMGLVLPVVIDDKPLSCYHLEVVECLFVYAFVLESEMKKDKRMAGVEIGWLPFTLGGTAALWNASCWALKIYRKPEEGGNR